MKKHTNRFAVLLSVLLIFCACVLPANAAAQQDLIVQGICGLQNETLLGVQVGIRELGLVQNAVFFLRYNPAVLKISKENIIYTNDYLLSYDLSVPGEISFWIAPCSPGFRYGRSSFLLSFTVIGEGDFGLHMIGGEYTDLQENTGTVDARDRFVAKRTLSVLPALPEGVASGRLRIGDVNFDQKITAADARLLLRAAVKMEKLTEAQALCADINDDGRVTGADARLALRDAVGL